MSVSNEVMLEGAVEDSYSFLKRLNQDGYDLTPMVYLYEKDNYHPFLVMGLPPQSDKQTEKIMSHMMLLPFINLLPTEAVVVVQDTWFVKADDDENLDVEKVGRPSQRIDKRSGLTSIQMRKDFSGIFSMKEYGMDDSGNLFTKETTNSVVSSFIDGDEVKDSWLVDILVQGFENREKLTELLTSEKDSDQTDDDIYLMTLMQGMTTCSKMGYNFAVRDDFGEFIKTNFSNANDELKEFFDDFQEHMNDEESE